MNKPNLKQHLRRTFFALAIVGALLALPKAEATITEVVGGLHSPRGLAFGPGGQLFVAQTGDETVAGSIIEILSPMAVHPQQTGDPAFGNLLRVDYRNQVQTLVNVGSFDYDWTAEHVNLYPPDFPDANPYGVLVLPGHTYVVDAGANTLNEVMPDGSIRILAFFPNNVLADATPTCACQGPDGFLYIGTLALVDSLFIAPSGKVYRLDPSQANIPEPWNTPMTVWASDLWPINGCTFGRDGNFYASQLFTNPNWIYGEDPEGDVVKIPFAS